jgi:hypothetical protein
MKEELSQNPGTKYNRGYFDRNPEKYFDRLKSNRTKSQEKKLKAKISRRGHCENRKAKACVDRTIKELHARGKDAFTISLRLELPMSRILSVIEEKAKE